MKKHTLFLLALSFSGVLAASGPAIKPVFDSDFVSGGKNLVSDHAEPPVGGKLRPGTAKVNSPFGTALQLEGKINNGALYPASSKLNLKSEFTVSIWFHLDALPEAGAKGAARSFTLLSRGNETWRSCIDSTGRLCVQTASPEKEYFIWNSGPGAVMAGKWCHAAYTYSVSKGEYALFLNGSLRSLRKTSVDKKRIAPVPIENLSPLLIGSLPNYFPMKGKIAGVKIFDRALSQTEIEKTERMNMQKFLHSLAADAEKANLKAFAERLRKSAAGHGLSFKTLFSIQKEYQALREELTSGDDGSALLWKSVNPTSQEIIYPDSPFGREHSQRALMIAAAKNEFEGASFVVRPFKEIVDFLPVAEKIDGPSGSLPPDAFDIRVLVPLAGKGRIVQGILLHDAAMVETDLEKFKTRLRLSFPGKTEYIDLGGDEKKYTLSDLHIKKMPVYDAPHIVPLKLKKGENTQFFITFKAPSSAKPGLYTGTVKLTAGGKTLGKIPLKVRILPFQLPDPAPKYDLSREFTTAAYYFDRLKNGTRYAEGSLCLYDRNMQQVKNELKDLYDHNINHPECIMSNNFPRWHTWGPKPWGEYKMDPRADEMMRVRLGLLREAGFPLKPFYLHTGGNIGFRNYYKRSEHKELLRDFVKRGNAFFTKELGHSDFFHYGIDEADGDVLKSEFEVWEDMREAGIKIFTTIQKKNVPVVAGKITTAVAVHTPDRESARMMHEKNGRLLMYATPYYATLENPFMHRKAVGFTLWDADYDGVYQYSYNHFSPELGLAWHNPSSLVFVMPTADGIVPGCGWEGFREGIDDVRYATLFLRLLEKARASSNPGLRNAAAKADAFLKSFNPSESGFDPATARLRMIGHILKLGNYKMEK